MSEQTKVIVRRYPPTAGSAGSGASGPKGEQLGAEQLDHVVSEEPLELQLIPQHTLGNSTPLPLATLMRTPNHDEELLRGWLHAEGLGFPGLSLSPHPENANLWHLSTTIAAHEERLAQGARLSVSSSACGICGTGSLEELAMRITSAGRPIKPYTHASAFLAALPEQLVGLQTLFAQTGGSHAAAVFSAEGKLLVLREDVGRHNAVDKVVGWLLQHVPEIPEGLVLCVSSRAGFEVVQKAVMAGLGTVVAVGAASSLAVECAATFGVHLYGFARHNKLTLYTGTAN